MNTIVQECTEQSTTPPGRWRNLFSTERPICTQRNGDVPPGEFWGSDMYPSREAAERQAREDMTRDVFYAVEHGVRYLGAFEIED